MFETFKIELNLRKLIRENLGSTKACLLAGSMIMDSHGKWAADQMKRNVWTLDQAAYAAMSMFVITGYNSKGLDLLREGMPDVYNVIKALYALGYKTVALSGNEELQRVFFTTKDGQLPFPT